MSIKTVLFLNPFVILLGFSNRDRSVLFGSCQKSIFAVGQWGCSLWCFTDNEQFGARKSNNPHFRGSPKHSAVIPRPGPCAQVVLLSPQGMSHDRSLNGGLSSERPPMSPQH